MAKNVTLTLNVREARRLALMLRLHSHDADQKSMACEPGTVAYKQWRRAARKSYALAGELEAAASDAEFW